MSEEEKPRMVVYGPTATIRVRIDDPDLCGHAIYQGQKRCPVCGRRLTTLEASRNLNAAGSDLARAVVKHLPRWLVRKR